MHKSIFFLISISILLAACGPSQAEHDAAVATQVALLIQQEAGEITQAPTPEATLEAGAPTPNPLLPSLPAEAACVPDNTERILAPVEEVWSGDSIGVRIDDALIEVRYIGIDGDNSDAALAANRQLVEGKEVQLIMDTTDRDEYGRMLRYVVVDGIFVNLELVRQGVAFVAIEEPDRACETTLNNAR